MTSSSIFQKLTQRVITFDVETTTTAKGSAFNASNKLVTIQYKINNEAPVVLIKEDFPEMLPILESASVVVGSNLKFDLHWLRRELNATVPCVWDCQLAEFILSKQQWKYPDLATMCDNYDVQRKIDVVKLEYWDKGIDTDAIPFEILAEYGAGDVESTYKVFLKQLARFEGDDNGMFKLFRLHCNDLLVLQEMEYNGIMYDVAASLEQSKSLEKQIARLEELIYVYTNGVPINLDSRDHVSVLLYGGGGGR